MSLHTILEPETKNQSWSKIYANRIETKTLEADEVEIKDIVIDSAEVKDLTVTGQAIISGVNFATIGSVGINGQVMTSLGDGSVQWTTNASGDVTGPGSAVSGNLSSFSGTSGKIIQDSGINASGGVLNPGSNWINLPVSNILWRAGAVSNKSVLGSWAEVVTYVNSNNGMMNIYVDDSLNPCIITSNLDCQGRVNFFPYKSNAGSSVVLSFDPDIQLTNPKSFNGISAINCNAVTLPNIIMSDGSLLIFQYGATLTNNGSLVPVIQVADNEGLILAFYLGSTIETTNGNAVVNLGVNSTVIIVQFTSGHVGSADIVSSVDASSTLINQSDAAGESYSNAGFTGTTVNQYVDNSLKVNYNDATQPIISLGDNVQAALDTLKQKSYLSVGFGATLSASSYAVFNGTSTATAGALSVDTSAICPINGSVVAVSYNTTSGDNTSSIGVVVNGVQYGFLQTGVTGVKTYPDGLIPVVAGQNLSMFYSGIGTAPGASNFVIYIQ